MKKYYLYVRQAGSDHEGDIPLTFEFETVDEALDAIKILANTTIYFLEYKILEV